MDGRSGTIIGVLLTTILVLGCWIRSIESSYSSVCAAFDKLAAEPAVVIGHYGDDGTMVTYDAGGR